MIFSQLNQPEQMDPENVEPVSKDDGEQVYALIDAFEQVIIFKKTNMFSLRGEDPQTWVVEKILPGYGTVSHRSVRFVNGTLYWWDPTYGPMSWLGPGNVPEPVGQVLLSATMSTSNLNYAKADRVVCGVEYNPEHELVIWGTVEKVPEGEASYTNNNIMLPFSYRLKRWTSEKWNPFDVASLESIQDSAGKYSLYVGGYFGQIFRFAEIDSDGVDSGTKTGSVSSATSNTLTDLVASFWTTGAGLKGRYVYVTSPGGFTTQRRRIGSNTSSTLTLDAGLTWETTPTGDVGYTYVIGGPDWQWDTINIVEADTFHKKRFRFALHQMKTTG